MISVESHMPTCLPECITAQETTLFDITEETSMAGLSCSEISQLAWELLQPSLSQCLAIDYDGVAPLMARFANGTIGGVQIEVGECATSGLAAVLAARDDLLCWQKLGFNLDSVILLSGSEGAPDANICAELSSLG